MAQEFLDVYRGFPASPRIAAHRLAAAYDAYAQQGLAAASKPSISPSAVVLLEETLYSAIRDPLFGTHLRFAQAWADGVFNYWMGPPVPFSGGGIVSGITADASAAKAAIFAGLTTLFGNVMNGVDLAANQQATILDAGTKLVVVLLVYPPAASVMTAVQ